MRIRSQIFRWFDGLHRQGASDQLETVEPKVFRRRLVGRSVEKFGEEFDAVQVGHLGRRREAADGHVVDQALAEGGDGLVAHWGLPSLGLRVWKSSFSGREVSGRYKSVLGTASILTGSILFALAVYPPISWSKERRSYGQTQISLSAPGAHDYVVIAPGVTDNSTHYKLLIQTTPQGGKTLLTNVRISGEYILKEVQSGFYSGVVLSTESYLVEVQTPDCIVKRPYIFSADETGRTGEIVIARNPYPDAIGSATTPSATVLDRLRLEKGRDGVWEASLLSEVRLDKYYCFDRDIVTRVFRFEQQ